MHLRASDLEGDTLLSGIDDTQPSAFWLDRITAGFTHTRTVCMRILASDLRAFLYPICIMMDRRETKELVLI